MYARPEGPALAIKDYVAEGCTRSGVLPANFTTEHGDLR
jgi:hypothetical protein